MNAEWKNATEEVTWEEFKQKIGAGSSQSIYRGQTNYEWGLVHTLYRFLGSEVKEYPAQKYHPSFLEAHKILNNNKISLPVPPTKAPHFTPFKGNLLYPPYDGNPKEVNDYFTILIKLRHLGFPSPILDWSACPYIAAFFAFSAQKLVNNVAIFALTLDKENIPTRTNFLSWGILTFDSKNNENHTRSLRDIAQQSVYLVISRYDDGVIFLNAPINPHEIKLPGITIKKYVISDSKERQKEILKELIALGNTYEKLYGETHPCENTQLKDIAIQHLLLN